MNTQKLPSNRIAQEFSEVTVQNTGKSLEILFTIAMKPQAEVIQGWQTGVALDASASMKSWYGRKLEGTIPPEIIAKYKKKGWVESRIEDGIRVKSFHKKAYEQAIKQGYLNPSHNIVQPMAREFTASLASNLDSHGGTTVIYWACGDGADIEVVGDFTVSQCRFIEVSGPGKVGLGQKTIITPAVKYFVERFSDAKYGIYIFITDGRIEDMEDIKEYTLELSQEIAFKERNPLKCILIGVGNGIDKHQLEELHHLDTGNNIDIWDYKIAGELQELVQICTEVVNENKIIAPRAVIYDNKGNLVKRFNDGLPAKVCISMPLTAQWFELEVYGKTICQAVIFPHENGQ